jgi:hypothetical protein
VNTTASANNRPASHLGYSESIAGDSESALGDNKSEMAESSSGWSSAITPSRGGADRRQALQAATSDADVSGADWTMDLSEVDEALEMSLSDPKAAGTVFIRLLVRAVGVLGCEDDVERMLLQDAAQKISATLKAIKVKEKKRVGDVSNVSAEVQEGIFSEYVKKLLDVVYFALRKLMYGLRLLRLSKNIRSGGISATTITTENTKKAILQMGDAASQLIRQELRVHLIEKEVVMMSDRTDKGRANERSMFKGDVDGDDASAESRMDTTTIVSPTLRLVAPIYQEVVAFSVKVHKLFREECSMTDAEIPPNRIVLTVERISERELLPLIQSHVSQSMNEIQANPALFSPPSKVDYAEAAAEQAAASRMSTRASIIDTTIRRTGAVHAGIICNAATRCLAAIKPLLTIWVQLPQHSEAVVTIIDRAIRGFVSCAREELEALSWKLHAWESQYKDKVVESLRSDPYFIDYRLSVFGDGCASVDELLGLAPAGSHSKRLLSRGSTGAVRGEPSRMDNAYERSVMTVSCNSGIDGLLPPNRYYRIY